MATSNQYCTFFVHDLYFGIDVLRVQEAISHQEMTNVPQAPDMIEGLINLRGQIVTAIDLRRRLKLPPREGDHLPMNVVVRTEDGVVSLLVDEIGDVVTVNASSCEPPPERLQGVSRQLVRSVHKLERQLLLVLDVDRTIEVSEAAGVPCQSAP